MPSSPPDPDQGAARGERPPHPPARPEPHLGVPQALLPRREPRDGGVPAPALQAAVHRDLRRGGRRAAALRGRATRSSATPSARRTRAATTAGSTCATSRSAACARSSSRSSPRTPIITGAASARSCSSSSSTSPACAAARTWCSRWRRTTRTRCAGTGARSFYRLDAAVFLAQKVETEPELLPPRRIGSRERGKRKAIKG